VASYGLNKRAVERARQLIRSRQYVLSSDWGQAQPRAEDENAFLASHSWDEYGEWHLGLTEGASEETKARYAFVYGDFRRLHRTGLIACHYRAAGWRHKEIELAASGQTRQVLPQRGFGSTSPSGPAAGGVKVRTFRTFSHPSAPSPHPENGFFTGKNAI
jgi:hypothetical protein